ncbi:MAG: L-erythro-3,5-diaminohexanoate dehydrogenase [Firmicutes bacterium]|nr:L-erythro-3,5-diaminohexanoate dehydrogenase [Candidatus Fermentithermobacillaceae bacterium]
MVEQRAVRTGGCPYGTHRVIEPKGVLPQAAWKIDPSEEIYDNEILVDVKTLNIDAASFKQLVDAAKKDLRDRGKPEPSESELEEAVARSIMDIVARRGKMHNPVTGSGGMLLGTIARFGDKVRGREGAKEGDLIATQASLSLTPLKIKTIKKVYLDKDQVDVEGTAVIFETAPFAVIPSDIDQRLALAVLDVAGAPVQTERLVKEGDSVLVLGAGGKSGLICMYVAGERVGPRGRVIGLAHSDASMRRARALGDRYVVIQGDAGDAIATMKKVMEANGGQKVDVTINCVNVPGTEMASILSTKERGKVYFFSMATSFTAAALGAEGVAADVELIIGNGYAAGHSRAALDLIRRAPVLRKILEEMFLS